MSAQKTPTNNSVIRVPDSRTPHFRSTYLSEQVFEPQTTAQLLVTAQADAWQAGYDAALNFMDGKTPVPENPYTPQTSEHTGSEQMSDQPAFKYADLQKIREVDLSEPCWSFDLLGAWKDPNGGIYLSTDSGCSCPTPWENHKQIDDFTGPLTVEQAIEESESLYRDYDRFDFEAFLESIRQVKP